MEHHRLRKLIIQLRSSFWFVPSLLIVASMLLAWSTVSADMYLIAPGGFLFNWINNIGPSGARAVFSTIAGSTITVAGVIFSIAMVVLTMASGQFGPRLIPTFMRVGKIQFGIGLFIGTFVYCLILLTFVPEARSGELLPIWGVLVGMMLGVFSFIVLIMLVHEIVTFIQAPVVADRVARDIHQTFDRIFLQAGDTPKPPHDADEECFNDSGVALKALFNGYVQTIDYDALVSLAKQNDCKIRMDIKPGDFVFDGQTIAMTVGCNADIDAMTAALCEQIGVGQTRNLAQDAEYSVDQMVEIAVRALSPGVNDPFTAINCIDKLSAAIAYLANRQTPSNWRLDDDSIPRLRTDIDTFESIVDSAFDQIRQNASGQPAVIIRLVEAIGRLGFLDLDPSLHNALKAQLDIIAATDRGGFIYQQDFETFEGRLRVAREAYRNNIR